MVQAEKQDGRRVEPAKCQQLDRWSKDEWAENIMAQDTMQQSVVELQRTYNDFQAHADERDKKMLDAARGEYSTYEGLALQLRKAQLSKQAPSSSKPLGRRIKDELKAGYSTFAETAYEYSKYFDVLADVAPEYVALAWGAIKILLVVQVNMTKLKQSVELHLNNIGWQIGFIESVVEYVPTAPMVRAVTEVYSNFSTFLREAIRYYTESKFARLAKALGRPWEVRFQDPVDRINRSVCQIKDIAQVEQLGLGQRGLAATEDVSQRMSSMSLRQDNLIEVQSISFNSIEVVKQMMIEMQQYVGERFDELGQKPSSSSSIQDQHSEEDVSSQLDDSDQSDDFLADHLNGDDFDRFRDRFFPDLQGLDDEATQNEAVMEQLPGMDSYRLKGLNLLRMERVISWIESDRSKILWVDGCGVLPKSEWNSSFVVPLMIDATSNYESVVILRHSFSMGSSSSRSRSCTILAQAFIVQLFKQRPDRFRSRNATFTRDRLRNAKDDVHKLWTIFLECLREVDVGCVYIIVDGIDQLQTSGVGGDHGEVDVLIQELNRLAKDETRLFKILVTAQLANFSRSTDANLSSALTVAQRKLSFSIVEDQWAMVQYKLSEIDEGKCKSVTFAQVWMLYRPKTTIYTIESDEWLAYVVEECSGLERKANGGYMPLQLKCWFVSYNGRKFTKRYRHFEVPQFSIGKAVSSLRYIPSGYLPNEGEIRSTLIERGRLFQARVDGMHLLDYYGSVAGKDFSEEPARVMVDYSMSDRSAARLQSTDSEETHGSVGGRQGLKPLTLLLCPPTVDVYFLQDNKWGGTARLDHLRDVKFDRDAWDGVVIRDGDMTKSLIEAVVMSYCAQQRSPKDTVVSHSSGSSVILLHGPPGVGKATSIEAIAEGEQVPLLCISGASLSNTPAEMSTTLRQIFDYALHWHAIVLLNDADVFLDKRDTTDVTRIRMTSLFAQEIKAFDGLLFLVTSRITGFDEEIHSAIQSTAVFKYLDRPCRVRIWKTMLRNLLPSIHQPARDVEELCRNIEGDDFNTGDFTPRQIRNCIRTAMALARTEAASQTRTRARQAAGGINLAEVAVVQPPVKMGHLRAASTRSRALVDYMNSIEAVKRQNALNESMRARH